MIARRLLVSALIAVILPFAGFLIALPLLPEGPGLKHTAASLERLVVGPDTRFGEMGSLTHRMDRDRLPAALGPRISERTLRWMRYAPPKFIDALTRRIRKLLLSEAGTDSSASPDPATRWIRTTRCAASGTLALLVETGLDRDSTEGLELCLDLPGMAWFEDHIPVGHPVGRALTALKASLGPKPYPGRPWFLRFHGDAILARLDGIRDPALTRCVRDRLVKALDDWNPETQLPWLPLAYFTVRSEFVSTGSLRRYLGRVEEGLFCPYLPSAAALYVDRAEIASIRRLIAELEPYGRLAGARNLERDQIGDGGYLYWLLVTAVCRYEGTDMRFKLLDFKDRLRFAPGDTALLPEREAAPRPEWILNDKAYFAGRRIESFHDYARRLSPRRNEKDWYRLEVLPAMQGHAFLDL